MPKKFDTNPLDPDFPEKAKAEAAPRYDAPPSSPYSTSEFPTTPPSITEEETRKFSEADFHAYSYQPTQPIAVYQTAATLADMNRASERKVAKTGLPERWLIGLPYIPFMIGLIAGLILLLIIPKEENKVRFHAAQGFAAHIAIAIVSAILGVVGDVTGIGFGGFIFWIASTVMMIIWAIKAFSGKPVHIELIDDLTNWFEEKIGPINKS